MRKLTICGTNIADFTIVIPTIPAPAEKTAAEFLQRVISASCGVTLSISDTKTSHSIILGGMDTDPNIKWDGFRMATDEQNLYLHGNVARGTLYAAYDFAEKYINYRYFADDCEVISTEGEAVVPCGLNTIDNPVFPARRTTCNQHMHSAELSAHCRLNDCMPSNEALGDQSSVGGACHTFDRLCPPSQYFDEHPEYYAYVIDDKTGEGKRLRCGNARSDGQLCLSNPDVLRIVIENVRKELREHPETKIVEVSQCDNSCYCQCEKCAAIDAEEGSPSGSMIRFVNAVAEAIEEEYPNVLVRTFAYQYSRTPPKLTKARHNVLVRYCTIEACYRHALNDPDCKSNSAVFRTELDGWGKMAEQISIWDYITDWACYSAPFPNLYSLLDNARFFADNHAIHVLEECNDGSNGGLNPELKAYLVGKLLWNPYMSREEYDRHIDEFLQGFYGKGWGEIRRVLDLFQEITKDRCVGCFDAVDIGAVNNGSYWTLHTDSHDFTDEAPVAREDYVPKPYQPTLQEHHLLGFIEHMDEIKALYDRAFALAETDAERRHLEISRFAVRYVDLFCTPHIKSQMTAEEQKAYEAEAEQFIKDKERLGCRYSLWTSNFQGR